MKECVSVCIPVYNGSATIVDTLDSVLQQTYKNIEIIIVDNCSTDNTVELVRGISDERIKLFCNAENIGMAGNWNKCLEYVTGEYIQFVCADDLLMPECIEKKVECIKSNPEAVMVFGASSIINERDEVLMSRCEYKRDMILDGNKLAKKSFYLKNIYGEPTNVLFKSSLVKEVGVFALNMCYATDWEYWLRLSCYGKVGFVSQDLVKYRISTSNETSKIKVKKFLDDDKIMVQNLIESDCMPINVFDKIIHRIMYIIRMYARIMYMKLKN